MLRKAIPEDCSLLFAWVNDPLVRKNSINSETIDWPTHLQWFQSKMSRPQESQIFIAVKEGNPVGQIRFDLNEGQAMITFSVAPASRGRGVGYQMLNEALKEIKNIWRRIDCFMGKVKKNNTASIRIFEKSGFKLRSESPYLIFDKKNNQRKS